MIDKLSNATPLTMAWFQVIGQGDENDDDYAFRQSLIAELHHRGVLNKPDLTHNSIIVTALTDDDLDSFCELFHQPGEPTFEDSFVLATLWVDSFKARQEACGCSGACVDCEA